MKKYLYNKYKKGGVLMKKSLLKLIVIVISISLLTVLVSSGCKPEEAEVKEEATEEEAEVAEEGAEEEVVAEEEAPAEEFDWKKYEGTTLNILMVAHNYTEGIINSIQEFEELTGIDVVEETLPENEERDKLSILLSAGNEDPDVFMSGEMEIWSYAPPGYIEPLDDYISDPSMTNPDYDYEDIFPRIREAAQWDTVDGHPVGSGSQWGIPLGFEMMELTYRADLFEKYDIEVPETLTEVYEAAKIIEENEPDMYGFSCRGLRNWNMIHTAPISLLANYGTRDFDDDLQPAMGSPEGIEFHKDFVKLLQDYGPTGWIGYEWYDVLADLAAGKAAIAIDCDILSSFAMREEGSVIAEPGTLKWAPVPTKPGGTDHKSNLWVWSLSMNANSDNKGAAWYFMQWASSKENDLRFALDLSRLDPVRDSTWNNEEFTAKLEASYPSYVDTFMYTVDNCSLLFTPQAKMAERVTEWAVAIQEMVEGADVEERLEKLVDDLTLE